MFTTSLSYPCPTSFCWRKPKQENLEHDYTDRRFPRSSTKSDQRHWHIGSTTGSAEMTMVIAFPRDAARSPWFDLSQCLLSRPRQTTAQVSLGARRRLLRRRLQRLIDVGDDVADVFDAD